MANSEPLFEVGSLVRHAGDGKQWWSDKLWRVIALDAFAPVITVWLRIEGGNHYATATTRELEAA